MTDRTLTPGTDRQLSSKAMDALAMSARSLLRQAQCPECHHNGMQGNRRCNWCAERAALMDGILSVQPNAHETFERQPDSVPPELCTNPFCIGGITDDGLCERCGGTGNLPPAQKAGAGE